MRYPKRENILKVFLFGTLFFVSVRLHAQNEKPVLLDNRATALAKQLKIDWLQKVVHHSTAERWDSVIVNTDIALRSTHDKTARDYLHFYRGQAFLRKGIISQARHEFALVRHSFDYYFKLRLFRGEMYMEKSQMEHALTEFEQIDTTSTFQLQNIKLGGVLHNIGLCYFHLGNYSKAEEYLLKAIHISSDSEYDARLSFYTALGNIYYEQYQDEKALTYFEKAYLLSKEHGSFEFKQNAALNMAVFRENQKKYAEALAFREEYENWRDSLMDQTKIYEVAQLEKKFAVDQKQREVKLLRTENKLKQTERNLYLMVALLLSIILIFGIYLYRQNVKRSRIILQQKTELDQLNRTKDRLFSIVSHDLRSSVHALKNSNSTLLGHLSAGRYNEAESQLEQNTSIATGTYNMLDNLLHWALLQTQGGYFNQEVHRIGMLADQVAYNFQALLKEKNIQFENRLPKTTKAFVDAESMKIVLRNFMDNSIKFSNPGAQIHLELLDETENTIRWAWVDTGKGMTEETRLKLLSDSSQLTKKEHEKEIGSGLGMSLCVSMIRKNGGSLDIQSKLQAGTRFIVTLQKKRLDGTAN